MSHFSENLKHHRKKAGLTQAQLAKKIGMNRATLASYEEQRAEPSFNTLSKLSAFLGTSLDELLMEDSKKKKKKRAQGEDLQKKIQVLPILVDEEENERICLVDKTATAGYLKGYEDAEFIAQLPSFSLPFDKTREGSYRVFQIQGDSMPPIPSGSYIIARFEDQWQSIGDFKPYIVVSKNDGISYKRIKMLSDQNCLLLRSDNPAYNDYKLPLSDLRELWKAVGYISFELDGEDDASNQLHALSNMFAELKNEVDQLKKKS